MMEQALTHTGERKSIVEIKNILKTITQGDPYARYKIMGSFGGSKTQKFAKHIGNGLYERIK